MPNDKCKKGRQGLDRFAFIIWHLSFAGRPDRAASTTVTRHPCRCGRSGTPGRRTPPPPGPRSVLPLTLFPRPSQPAPVGALITRHHFRLSANEQRGWQSGGGDRKSFLGKESDRAVITCLPTCAR